ncbi:TRAP transporter substrate-binding protein [Acuticoccus sp. M5D2P5]|uniref:TRAP transporter substrate-binding protein n=1 Tax=Acuticoccus kalidii TaxID=2910977 RepID=UPI001F40703F|nr:TRAP transporter substrate-binding protein [Acuticoccus kalidii]MCF3934490.1 TRAP transporter substrate-binding protein [Acuticoccus kalidii]
MKSLKAAAGSALIASMVFAVPASAQTRWDMATPYPDAEFHTKNIRQFAEDVATATDGDLEITVHSGQSLFKHPEIKRSVQYQLVPLGEVLMGNLYNEDPLFGADNIPFIATSYDKAKALWDAQRPMIEEKLAADGIRLLFAVPWPGQGFYLTDAIETADDLKGVRFRTYNATTARMAELLGMVPTTVEAVEIPQAFSTGIVDGMVTSAATGVRTKAWDFTDNFYDINAWLPKNMIIVNESAFSSLPEETQAAVLEAAKTAETRGWEMSQAESTSAVETLAENMNVIEPTDTLMSGLQAVGEEMATEWAEASGDEGKTVLDAIK